MKIKKGAPVVLNTFLGTSIAQEEQNSCEDYWILIGEVGRVVAVDESNLEKVLVLFGKNLNDLKLDNHNPIANSLWIDKSDLKIDKFQYNADKLEREVRNMSSFMSNTKWFKLFSEIEKLNLCIRSAYIKFVLTEKQYRFRITGFDSNGFGDVSELGPFEYKEIEWISIPEKFEIERRNRDEKFSSEFVSQPVNEVEKLINTLGKFEYDRTEREIKIYGYKYNAS